MPRHRHRRASTPPPKSVPSFNQTDASPRRNGPAPLEARPFHATGYPSPEERLRIVERRDRLVRELISLFALGKPKDAQLEKLTREYGESEVLRVNDILHRQFQRSRFLVDEPESYRHYRLGFARFGGTRRFLSAEEHGQLIYEHGLLFAQREFKAPFSLKPSPREEELRNLLRMDWQFWEDITPPDVPPRPADFPAPASYPPPLADILAWGWDLDPQRIIREQSNWQAYPIQLERIVFDESLRSGWPGEPASWAPRHALHLLGALRVFSVARRLVNLFNLPNDWLSDCLPDVWAQMGAPAEISLWDILDDPQCHPDQRGLACAGLRDLVENKSLPRLSTLRALAERLSPARDYDPTVNACIIVVLEQLDAVEVKDAIRAAFENGRVDVKITTAENIPFLGEEEE